MFLVVNCDFIKDNWDEAHQLIGRRDRSDVPLIALVLTLKDHDGIWSTDKDFRDKGAIQVKSEGALLCLFVPQ